jgi:hypothetical protein
MRELEALRRRHTGAREQVRCWVCGDQQHKQAWQAKRVTTTDRVKQTACTSRANATHCACSRPERMHASWWRVLVSHAYT